MNKETSKWRVLSSEYLFNEPWFTARRDRLELPNGKIIPAYYVLEYPNWVNMIAITRDKEFIFVRQYRHGLDFHGLELCAGVCEKEDGSPLISAQRELLEESGYGNGTWKEWMVISANPSTMNNLTYCYLATDVEKVAEPRLDDTEYLTVELLTADQVKELLEKDEIKQSLHAAPLWKYAALHLL